MPFVKFTLTNGRETYLNSDFIFEIRDSQGCPGVCRLSLDLEEGDPSVEVQGNANDIAAQINAAVAAE